MIVIYRKWKFGRMKLFFLGQRNGDQLEALFLNDHSSSLPLQSSSFSDILGLGNYLNVNRKETVF